MEADIEVRNGRAQAEIDILAGGHRLEVVVDLEAGAVVSLRGR